MTARRALRPPTLPATVLRQAVAREVATLSLRRAASEIGLSPNGLRNFLAGAVPRPATRARLEAWLADRRRGQSGPTVGSLVRLLSELGADLPARERAALGQDVVQFLVRAYRDHKLPPPRWVRELASHYRVRPASPD